MGEDLNRTVEGDSSSKRQLFNATIYSTRQEQQQAIYDVHTRTCYNWGQLRNPSSKSVVSPRKNSGTERVNQNVGRDTSISLHLFLELSLSFFCQTAFTAKGISTLAAISPFIVM